MTHTVRQDLINAGFEHTYFPAEYYDSGDAENGPYLIGHGDFDQYCDGEVYLTFVSDELVNIEMRDHKLEAWIDQMASPEYILW